MMTVNPALDYRGARDLPWHVLLGRGIPSFWRFFPPGSFRGAKEPPPLFLLSVKPHQWCYIPPWNLMGLR